MLSDSRAFYVGMLFVSLVLIFRALTYDLFMDESDSPPSEIANELRGVKATKGNRILMVCILSGFAAFAIWKLVKG
jgi:hypothetical protein